MIVHSASIRAMSSGAIASGGSGSAFDVASMSACVRVISPLSSPYMTYAITSFAVAAVPPPPPPNIELTGGSGGLHTIFMLPALKSPVTTHVCTSSAVLHVAIETEMPKLSRSFVSLSCPHVLPLHSSWRQSGPP